MSEILNNRIYTSTDWAPIETKLIRQSCKLKYGADIKHLVKNINKEITELSRAEVAARQGNKIKVKEILSKVNEDISIVEEFLVVAALLG